MSCDARGPARVKSTVNKRAVFGDSKAPKTSSSLYSWRTPRPNPHQSRRSLGLVHLNWFTWTGPNLRYFPEAPWNICAPARLSFQALGVEVRLWLGRVRVRRGPTPTSNYPRHNPSPSPSPGPGPGPSPNQRQPCFYDARLPSLVCSSQRTSSRLPG